MNRIELLQAICFYLLFVNIQGQGTDTENVKRID